MRRTSIVLLASLTLAPGLAGAQPEPEDAPPTPVEGAPAPADPAALAEPEPLPPPPPDVAPMPLPTEDFTIDRDAFKEVATDPESQLDEEARRGAELAESERPLYRRMPGLAYATEVIAGLFGAGAFGLLGGTIGEAIDPGNDKLSFGGLHGALFGGLIGSFIGATGGVWGAAHLFEKDLNWGWALLGSALGTAVGGSVAFGIVEGIGGSGDGAEALGVAVLFLMQVGGAIGLSEAFLVEPTGPAERPRVEALPGGDLGARPPVLSVPLLRGVF